MNFGNMPADSGKLLFNIQEKNQLLEKEPLIRKYFKRVYGSEELINGKERWCLWFEDSSIEEINAFPELKKNYR